MYAMQMQCMMTIIICHKHCTHYILTSQILKYIHSFYCKSHYHHFHHHYHHSLSIWYFPNPTHNQRALKPTSKYRNHVVYEFRLRLIRRRVSVSCRHSPNSPSRSISLLATTAMNDWIIEWTGPGFSFTSQRGELEGRRFRLLLELSY
jgi:hypothetical protein